MSNFAVIDITFTPGQTNELVLVTTNNPCHLTLLWTTVTPQRHKNTIIKRGIELPWGAYFCFVASTPINQQEAGDTLTHTFDITGWTYDEIRYLILYGTYLGTPSPSVSPIFKRHFLTPTYPTPFQDTHILQYYPDRNYGTMILFAIRDANNYAARTLISFNLTSIPPLTTITHAYLYLYYFYYAFAHPTGKPVSIYKCTRPTWAGLQATWNDYKTLTPWTTPGGDYETLDPPASSFIFPPAYGWIQIDVSRIIQNAINNHINAHFLIKFDDETLGPLAFSVPMFRSTNYTADPTLRPQLIITYP